MFTSTGEIVPDAGLDGDVGGGLEVVGDLADGFGIGVVVPDGLQGIAVADDERVRAVLVRIVIGGELLRGHVGRIEAGAGRFRAVTLDEGLSVDAVPGAVVDFSVQFGCGILQGGEQGFLVPEILLPIDLVHLVGCKTVQVQDFLAIVRDSREVRSGNRHLCIVLRKTGGLGPLRTAGNRHQSQDQPCDCQFFHNLHS